MHSDVPRWFWDGLACYRCGRGQPDPTHGQLSCASCATTSVLRDGIFHALSPEMSFAVERQRYGWRLLERARATLHLSPEQVAALPTEPRTRTLLSWLRSVLRSRGPSRVLELGAGRGWAARALAEDGHQVVALDQLDDADIGLGCCVRQRTSTGAWFGCVRAEAELLPFLSESFDCVVAFTTLQHILDLERVLQQIGRVLRPGGIFVAFQDAYRGLLCTPRRRRQDGVLLTVGTLDREDADAEKEQGKPSRPWANLAYGPHDIGRRALACRDLAAQSGLTARVLPAAIAHRASPEFALDLAEPSLRSECLAALAAAYELDGERLSAWMEAARRSTGSDLLPALLAYWIVVGNLDGVLLARKHGAEPQPELLPFFRDPARCRQLEPLLLASSRYGYLPAYGVREAVAGHDGRTRWISPEAGLLVPAGSSLELTLTALSPPVLDEIVRLEVRREQETHPTVVMALLNGQTATLRVPLAPPPGPTGATLVHLRVDPPIYSWGDGQGSPGDIRMFAGAQLRDVRTVAVSPDQVAGVLARWRPAA